MPKKEKQGVVIRLWNQIKTTKLMMKAMFAM